MALHIMIGMSESLPICQTHKKPGWITTGAIALYVCPRKGCRVAGAAPGRCPTHDVALIERGERKISLVVCEDCFR